jgi:hypothetical protein
MNGGELIKYNAIALMLLIAACGNKKHQATDVLPAVAVATDSIVPIAESAKESRDSVYYYWPYSGNGDNEYLYNVAELIFKGDKICAGYFWCTSDEFNELANEKKSYYPGFIVLPMLDIAQNSDTLRFVLDSKGQKYYSAPVSINIHNPAKEGGDSIYTWLQPSDYFWDRVKYTAVFNKKEFTVIGKSKYAYPDNAHHTFYAVEGYVLPHILPEFWDEKYNRAEKEIKIELEQNKLEEYVSEPQVILPKYP